MEYASSVSSVSSVIVSEESDIEVIEPTRETSLTFTPTKRHVQILFIYSGGGCLFVFIAM